MALEAKHSFVSTYWAYRSYLASRLPSVTLYGNLMNYDRSLTLLQSYEDGTFKYAETFNLQNSMGLQVSQNISLTGGRVLLYSDLSRIDQFGVNNKLTWYTQPVTMSYIQPLFAYNQFLRITNGNYRNLRQCIRRQRTNRYLQQCDIH
mgnify:CR=1 FL=1